MSQSYRERVKQIIDDMGDTSDVCGEATELLTQAKDHLTHAYDCFVDVAAIMHRGMTPNQIERTKKMFEDMDAIDVGSDPVKAAEDMLKALGTYQDDIWLETAANLIKADCVSPEKQAKREALSADVEAYLKSDRDPNKMRQIIEQYVKEAP